MRTAVPATKSERKIEEYDARASNRTICAAADDD
jgi:hypothetical protein